MSSRNEQIVQLPLTVPRTQDAVTLLTVDFGRIVAGHVELEVDAASGVRLDLLCQEFAVYDAVAGAVDSAPRSSASCTTRGSADHYKVLGSAAFGAAAIIASVVANAGQSIELVRSKRIVGVSVLFLILAVVNQGLWLSWAILVPDIGTMIFATGAMIFATVTGIITVFNLIWWSLRILGLPPLLAASTPGQGRRPTAVQPQPASSGPPKSGHGSQLGHSSMNPTP